LSPGSTFVNPHSGRCVAKGKLPTLLPIPVQAKNSGFGKGEHSMSKTLALALTLALGVGLLAAPAMAQADESDNLDSIRRGGAEGAADTTLGSKGLVFKTDGFELRLTTRVQFRLTYQNEVAGGEGQDDSATNGRDFINFRVRRAKSTFSGYIFEKEFQYKVTLAWTGGSTNNLIEEAYFRWAVMQYINITAGQTKLPWNWEEITSSGSQQFVERSYVNEVFNQDFAKGITIDGKIGEDTPWLKYWFGVYNGVLKGASDFRNADQPSLSETFSNLVDNEMMLNLRLETHPLGEVKYGMNDMRGEDEYDQVLFAIGLGVNWFMSGVPTTSAVRGDDSGLGAPNGHLRTSQDTWAITLDGHFRWHGLSVDIAYFWRITDFHNRGANSFDPTSQADVGNVEDSGFTFEVAYMIIPGMFNVGIRFNMLNAEDFWQGGVNPSTAGTPRAFGIRPDATEIGVSANWFLHGDNLKLTFDFLWVGQQVPLGGNGTSLLGIYNNPPERLLGGGTIGSSDADHNDLWIVRLQLQWIF
jgi:phosphate-selective porin OprO/OprP